MLNATRYTPLFRYLSDLSGDHDTLSFDQIEAIIRHPLPPSASGVHARQWWANTSTHSQGQAWMAAGWRVEDVDFASRRIRFARARERTGMGERPPAEFISGAALPIARRAFSAGALRMIADYADAIGGDEVAAVVRIVEDAALERRKQLLARFAELSPHLRGDSSDLIREDRDAR